MIAQAECEAIRVLRMIVEGDDDETFSGLTQARALLHGLRLPRNAKQTGRPLSKVSMEQLREVARLNAQNFSQHEIARRVGITRDNVAHHLTPSPSMMDALLEKTGERIEEAGDKCAPAVEVSHG